MSAEYKMYDSGGKSLDVWIAYGFNTNMTPTSQKIIQIGEHCSLKNK